MKWKSVLIFFLIFVLCISLPIIIPILIKNEITIDEMKKYEIVDYDIDKDGIIIVVKDQNKFKTINISSHGYDITIPTINSPKELIGKTMYYHESYIIYANKIIIK